MNFKVLLPPSLGTIPYEYGRITAEVNGAVVCVMETSTVPRKSK